MSTTIIISPIYVDLRRDIDSLRDGLLALYLEHDELLFHVCDNLKTAYMLKFGAFEYNAYEWECKVRRIRRKIELARVDLNCGEPLDITAIDMRLDVEYAEYTKNLKKKINDINEALYRKNHGRMLSDNDSAELKKLYRAIVLRLHPDVNQNVSAWELDLFNNAVDAYKNGDLEALRTVYVLIDAKEPKKINTESPIELLTRQKQELEDCVNIVQKKIADIKASFPYNKKALLNDETRGTEYVESLNKIISDYENTYKMYEQQLQEILR
jgi:hypothetical protein